MRSLLAVGLFLLGLSGCSTDFELEAPWQDVPVIYGFLSLQDTAHYLRIEKAFLEPGGNAQQIAGIADSSYYGPEAQVFLEKVNTGQRYELQRVDASNEGYPRIAGPFAQTPNILYKIAAEDIELRAGQPVRMLLERNTGLPVVSAETTILDNITIRTANPVSPVNMDYDRTINFVFSVGEAAALFDIRLLIHLRETRSGVDRLTTLTWVLDDQLQRSSTEGRVSIGITGEAFYRYLGSALEAETGLQREFLGFDVSITAGGEAFVELLRLQTANAGLTSAQQIPSYSNISEGIGIFSSRSSAIRAGLEITASSLDSLKDGRFTRDLGFQ